MRRAEVLALRWQDIDLFDRAYSDMSKELEAPRSGDQTASGLQAAGVQTDATAFHASAERPAEVPAKVAD